MIRGIYHLVFNPRARAEWRWIFLTGFAKRIIPGYRLQWPQTAWWQDKQFNTFLKRFNELEGHNADRRWMIAQLCKLAASVPGDTAECGVFEGASSYLIANAFSDRKHHAFDSFEGCSAPTEGDSGHFPAGLYTIDPQLVKDKLSDCHNIEIYKGWIPERFNEISEKRFAFVHIDVQQEQPTRDSLEFFYPRMNRGGIIVFDDYGFTTSQGARTAVDKTLKGKPENIIELACCSAFLVKS